MLPEPQLNAAFMPQSVSTDTEGVSSFGPGRVGVQERREENRHLQAGPT